MCLNKQTRTVEDFLYLWAVLFGGWAGYRRKFSSDFVNILFLFGFRPFRSGWRSPTASMTTAQGHEAKRFAGRFVGCKSLKKKSTYGTEEAAWRVSGERLETRSAHIHGSHVRTDWAHQDIVNSEHLPDFLSNCTTIWVYTVTDGISRPCPFRKKGPTLNPMFEKSNSTAAPIFGPNFNVRDCAVGFTTVLRYTPRGGGAWSR
jgi:hypothetical protein